MAGTIAMMRAIKLRSVENAIYKPSYNRLSFQIADDTMSTDFSQSYLAARLYLTDSDGNDFTPADFASWAAQNIMVSFGHDNDNYSPACLIKTARLIAKGNGAILEEINFANVLSQTLFQYTADKESVSSSTLLYGETVTGLLGNSLDVLKSSLYKNPMEVHIPLKSFLGLGQHTNFHLSATKGLILQLELEDNKSLFQFNATPQSQSLRKGPEADSGELPGIDTYPPVSEALTYRYRNSTGFNPQPETYPYNPIKSSAFEMFIDPSGDTFPIAMPRSGMRYDGSYFVAPFDGVNILTGLQIRTRVGALQPLTTPYLNALGFNVGDFLKLSFTIPDPNFTPTDPNYAQPKILEYLAQIDYLTPGTETSPGVLTDAIIGLDCCLFYDVAALTVLPVLKSVEVLGVYSNAIDDFEGGDLIKVALPLNTIEFGLTTMTTLQRMGVISVLNGSVFDGTAEGTDIVAGPNDFDLSVQYSLQSNIIADASGTVGVVQAVVTAQGQSSQRVIMNGMNHLPIQGKKCAFKACEKLGDGAGATYVIEFTDLGQEKEQLKFKFLAYDGTEVTPTMKRVCISQCNATVIDETFNPPPAISYRIDRFEIVLIQQTKNPKFPMAMNYSTYKLEPATIESNQQQWQRQFIISEPSCYNIMMLLPDYNGGVLSPLGGGSLISRNRGVSNYRWQVNNVDATNRNIYLQDATTDYPSSLHRDKLLDFFMNSTYSLKNLEGIKGVSGTPYPVEMLPLKVYSGVVGNNLIPNPNGYTAQLMLFADPTMPGRTIRPGPVFLYKFCIRSL